MSQDTVRPWNFETNTKPSGFFVSHFVRNLQGLPAVAFFLARSHDIRCQSATRDCFYEGSDQGLLLLFHFSEEIEI